MSILRSIRREAGALRWTAGMEVDADGAPNAYGPDGGLDFLANAGQPGNWYGLVTDTGRPDGQPVRQPDGHYVSQTALCDDSKAESDPARYVDSSTVPYVVIPPELRALGAALGDVCWVRYRGRACGAVVADVGPHGKVGEGSIALAAALGVPSSPKNGGVEGGVEYSLFPESSRGWPRTVEDVQAQAQAMFQQRFPEE